MKLSKFKKRALIVFGTVVGVIALFLIVVFIPIGGSETKTTSTDKDIAAESTSSEDVGDMSKKELEERVKELEAENQELKDDVERYKILAEQTTKAVSSPSVSKSQSSSNSTDSKKTNSSSSNKKTEYKDSSEYYDENYKNYTNDDDEKTSSSDTTTSAPSNSGSSSENSSSNIDSSNTSDTGL